MTNAHLQAARSILSKSLNVPPSAISLSSTRLKGGTEATGVHRVSSSYTDGQGRQRRKRLVVKHLSGRARREAGILQRLAARGDCALLPQLIGSVEDGRDDTFLGLAEVRPSSVWPWRSNQATAGLLQALGQFHRINPRDVLAPKCWDYEADLIASAQATRRDLHRCRRNPDFAGLSRGIAAVDKVVEDLPRLRRALSQEQPFGARMIHGDVHSGNAFVRRGAAQKPVLIDWGRARQGSPLEDVSSMLQSLRLYEPAALQRHDSLLKAYLAAHYGEDRITDTTRSAYWVAGASNALAGALSWHLMIASDENRSSQHRAAAFGAAKDCLRVIRRACAWAL
nr:aminoglycoside phosphotransferase family protein [Tianweitania aestuarii]